MDAKARFKGLRRARKSGTAMLAPFFAAQAGLPADGGVNFSSNLNKLKAPDKTPGTLSRFAPQAGLEPATL